MAILVRHAMSESPKTATPDMTAGDAAALMKQFDVGVIPIVQEGKLAGLVTDRDLVLRVIANRQDSDQVRLGDILTRSPATVTPDTRLAEARDLMAQHRVRRLPVLKGEELVGMLSLGDVALASASERAVGEALEDISQSASTADISGGPDRGTPDRVQQHQDRLGA
jgi:CBS domain-containing protein